MNIIISFDPALNVYKAYNTLYICSSSKVVSNRKWHHILRTNALTEIEIYNALLFKELYKGKNRLSFTDAVSIDNLCLLPTSTASITDLLVPCVSG